MKQFVFLLRDPGAYAAIYPVFLTLCADDSIKCKLFCFGTAAQMNSEFASNEMDAQRWIENHIQDIDVLICGTGFHTEPELFMMEACKRNGVCTVAILDYWSMYKNRFLANERFIWPNYYLVMDKIAKKEAIEDGVPEDIILVLGHPGLDETLQKAKETRTIATDSVLLLGEPVDTPDGEVYEEYFFSDCVHVLTEMGIDFSVKFHPRDCDAVREKYEKYSIEGDLLEIIRKYDIIIAMTTIALLHAALVGKYTISYQPGLSTRDECISSRLGLSRLVTSQDDLAKALVAKRPRLSDCETSSELLWLDGKSTERIVRFLKEV